MLEREAARQVEAGFRRGATTEVLTLRVGLSLRRPVGCRVGWMAKPNMQRWSLFYRSGPTSDSDAKAKEAFFGPVFEKRIGWRYRWIAGVAVFYFVVCLICCVGFKPYLLAKCPCMPWHALKLIAVFSWVIGPPVWFYIEYAYFIGRKKLGWEYPVSVERYKYTQDLLTKLWVVLAATLAYAANVKP
jgi:hypothetical protein